MTTRRPVIGAAVAGSSIATSNASADIGRSTTAYCASAMRKPLPVFGVLIVVGVQRCSAKPLPRAARRSRCPATHASTTSAEGAAICASSAAMRARSASSSPVASVVPTSCVGWAFWPPSPPCAGSLVWLKNANSP